jgi:uncharacterized OB-fold protein
VSAAPRPVLDDPETAGYWAAARRGVLAVCRCGGCGQVLHPPRGICSACHGTDVVWTPVAPRARLVSWTVAEHAVHPAFPVPYTVVLVELDDEPEVRLVGHLPGRPELRAGLPMRAEFRAADAEVTLVAWVPADSSI